MSLRSLSPRLNYHFSLSDFFIAVVGIFTSKKNKLGFENYFPNAKVYYTNHARTGLRILLNSFDLSENSKVGVLVYNCLTVFESINLAGFIPVFIESTNNYKIDVEDLRRKEEKIDALIVTHLFGIPSEIETIKSIMGKKPIIEDCAHAFLNKKNGKYLGSFGDGSIFSFGHAKFPAAAEGGIVIINNHKIESDFQKMFNKLKDENIFIQLTNVFKALLSTILMNKYIYGIFTYKLKQNVGDKVDLNNKYVFHERKVNKGFLKVFKKRLSRIQKLKTTQNKNSINILNSIEDVKSNSNQANFMIPVKSKDSRALISVAFDNGIEFGQHFKKSILWAQNYGYRVNDCKNTENLIDKTVTVPCYYRLSKQDIAKIEHVLQLPEIKKNLY
jgi:perosamine synthetase